MAEAAEFKASSDPALLAATAARAALEHPEHNWVSNCFSMRQDLREVLDALAVGC